MTKHLVFAAFLAVAASSMPARASILNLGAEVGTNGSVTPVPFFEEKATGYSMSGPGWFIIFSLPGQSLTITLNTAAAFGPGPLSAAELFIDAFDIDGGNSSQVYVQGTLMGSLANTADPSLVPVAAGPFGTHVSNAGDVDNTFFNLAPFLTSLVTDTTFTIEIRNTTLGFLSLGETIRVDGVNIQVQTAETPVPVEIGAPEPMTLAVWSGLAGIGGIVAWRRKRNAA